MACIDLDKARDIVEKHKDLFEKIVSEGKFDETVRKMMSKVYFVILITKTVFIGTVWWILTKWDPTYGTFFLLGLAMVQAKYLLDNDITSFEDNIIEAATELGIGKEEHGNSERSSDERNSAEDKEVKASEDSDSAEAKA